MCLALGKLYIQGIKQVENPFSSKNITESQETIKKCMALRVLHIQSVKYLSFLWKKREFSFSIFSGKDVRVFSTL